MKNKKRKPLTVSIVLILVLSLSLIGCTSNQNNVKIASSSSNTYNTWCTYWMSDKKVIQKLKQKESNLAVVNFYAAYYNGENLYVPNEILQLYESSKTLKFKKYITVVDDIENKSSDTKDTIIKQKLRNEETIKKHINELVTMVKQYQFDGIELDYQKVNDELELWPNYISLINKLYVALNKENKGLRIILNDETPLKTICLPNGPQYVMRCYDLFNATTKPGPKADRAYLESLKERTSNIKDIEYALSIGGYDWGKEAVSISVEEAEALAKKKQVEVKRDPSGACYYQYIQSDTTHTVWYSDDKSIMSWQEMLDNKKVSIWKIEN